MNSLLALGARALTMVISLLCGVVTARLILGEVGVEHYALYSLLTTLPALLAFTDLGSGAVIVNSVATSDDIRTDGHLRAQLTAVGRILLLFALCTMTVNAIMLISGGWRALLGDAGDLPGAPLASFFCVLVFCLGIPVGIWVRIMLGLRRNHIVILLQGLISPLTLLGVWLILQVGEVAASFLAIASFAASFAVSALGLTLTSRWTSPLVSSASRRVLHPRRFPGVRVMDVGWPMLAQLVTYPIAVSSQRFVLAQSGTHADVAEYGVTGQVFFAMNGLVIAAGVALWPYFARQRHRGAIRRGPFLLSAAFAGGVLLGTLVVWLASPWLFRFISDGRIEVANATILAFGLMVTMTAAVYPLGMFIMDKPGIRFQVIPTLSMAVVSFSLSVLLTPFLGVPGPLLGSAFALFACQYVPFTLYILRHRERLMPSSAQQNPVADDEPVR